MTVENPRPGDRFRVTFEGTFRAAPDRVHLGENAGLPWGLITKHAIDVEPISPEIVDGALYMDSHGNGWRGDNGWDDGLWIVPICGDGPGRIPTPLEKSYTIPGLRRARLIADEDDDGIGVVQWPDGFVKSQVAAWQARDATERCTSGNPRLGTVCTLMRGHDGVHFHAPVLPPLPSQDSSCGCA